MTTLVHCISCDMTLLYSVFRQAILSSMPRRSVIAATPFMSQSNDIGEYMYFFMLLFCILRVHVVWKRAADVTYLLLLCVYTVLRVMWPGGVVARALDY